jgi:hypothetical protein
MHALSQCYVFYMLMCSLKKSAFPLDMEFEGIAGIFKLSNKYDIPHVRSRAISHLMAIYPTTLTAWDQRKIVLQKSSFSPFAVLELAQSMDIPQILPAVFLDCSTQSTEALVDGFKYLSTQNPTLASTNLRTFVDARQMLLQAKLTRLYGFLRDEDSASCPDKYRNCPLKRLEWMTRTSNSHHVESPLAIDIDWMRYGWDVCEFCLLRAKEGYNSARQKLWNDLPSFFDLPAWDQLQSQMQ